MLKGLSVDLLLLLSRPVESNSVLILLSQLHQGSAVPGIFQWARVLEWGCHCLLPKWIGCALLHADPGAVGGGGSSQRGHPSLGATGDLGISPIYLEWRKGIL